MSFTSRGFRDLRVIGVGVGFGVGMGLGEGCMELLFVIDCGVRSELVPLPADRIGIGNAVGVGISLGVGSHSRSGSIWGVHL